MAPPTGALGGALVRAVGAVAVAVTDARPRHAAAAAGELVDSAVGALAVQLVVAVSAVLQAVTHQTGVKTHPLLTAQVLGLTASCNSTWQAHTAQVLEIKAGCNSTWQFLTAQVLGLTASCNSTWQFFTAQAAGIRIAYGTDTVSLTDPGEHD